MYVDGQNVQYPDYGNAVVNPINGALNEFFQLATPPNILPNSNICPTPQQQPLASSPFRNGV